MSPAFGAALKADNVTSMQRAVLESLVVATSAILDSDNWTHPFAPAVVIRGERSPTPEDLRPDQLRLLERIAPMVEEPALRARVADVAWHYGNRGRTDLLAIAIDAYCLTPLDYKPWIAGGRASWRRAYDLVRHQGKPGRARAQQMNNILQHRILNGTADDGLIISEVSQLLRRHSRPDPAAITAIAHQMRTLAAATPGTHRRVARMLEREAMQWFRIDQDETAVNHAICRIAELYVADADSRKDQHPAVAAGASVFIEKAIAELAPLPRRFRKDCGIDEQIQELRSRLKHLRMSLIDQMVSYESEPVDITQYVEGARQSVTGREQFDALASFANIFPVVDSAALQRSAKERLDGSLASLFRAETLSHDGRKVANTAGSEQDDEVRAWSEAVRDFRIHVQLVTVGFILPAQEVLTFEHRWDKDFIQQLCVESPFVSSSQALLWTIGLLHGFNGDYASAVSMLIPVLENSVRLILKASGVNTVLVAADGVESEKGLGALLATSAADDLLGRDLVFVLRALLTERAGPNLRNNALHGLLSDQQSWSYGAVYIWWICSKLVVLPVWNACRGRRSSSTMSSDDDAHETKAR